MYDKYFTRWWELDDGQLLQAYDDLGSSIKNILALKDADKEYSYSDAEMLTMKSLTQKREEILKQLGHRFITQLRYEGVTEL